MSISEISHHRMRPTTGWLAGRLSFERAKIRHRRRYWPTNLGLIRARTYLEADRATDRSAERLIGRLIMCALEITSTTMDERLCRAGRQFAPVEFGRRRCRRSSGEMR